MAKKPKEAKGRSQGHLPHARDERIIGGTYRPSDPKPAPRDTVMGHECITPSMKS